MKHLGTQRLETERLILRPFRLEDAAAMYENWAKDPAVTEFLSWPAYKSVKDADSILNIWTGEYEKKDFYQWAIELKELEQPIGSISVVEHKDREAMAHIGYCIGKSWWGRGITAEALKAVMDFLFDQVGMNRIEAMYDVRNPNSGRVMEKCGMVYEGTLRQAVCSNAGLGDVRILSRLASDR